jgi:hypothetical protein
MSRYFKLGLFATFLFLVSNVKCATIEKHTPLSPPSTPSVSSGISDTRKQADSSFGVDGKKSYSESKPVKKEENWTKGLKDGWVVNSGNSIAPTMLFPVAFAILPVSLS